MDTTQFDNQYDDLFEDIISKLSILTAQKDQIDTSSLNDFWSYLQKCETIFTSKSYDDNINPDDMENILSLHILNHRIPKELTKLLRELGLPISAVEKDIAESHPFWDGWVYKNGTLFAFAKYCQLDPMWAIVLVYYAFYKIFPKEKHSFVAQSKIGNEFNSCSPNGARIAIIGDWGTGVYKDGHVEKCPAQLVIDGIMKLEKVPDYIIHLGDVYYAGTKKEERDNFIGLLNTLPADYTGQIFTMNSNHEMYDGANGLFEETITNPLFKPQNGSTYFSIEVGDWIIVGLDSAYYDKSHLYMDGAIFNGNNGKEQVDFLREKAAIEGKQLLLLTHHNPIEYDGSGFVDSDKNEGSLWEQVVDNALEGRIPDAWYWGHIHNGIVYDVPALLQRKDNTLNIKLKPGENPLLRCCGHASIPFGKGSGLFNKETGKNNPGIAYFGETAMDSPQPTVSQKLRVLNGFAVIDIKGSEFTETFYEVSNTYPEGSPKPVWHSFIK